MSIMAMASTRARSSSADGSRISSLDEGKLAKVPKIDDTPRMSVVEKVVLESSEDEKRVGKKKTGKIAKKMEVKRKKGRKKFEHEEEYVEEEDEDETEEEILEDTSDIEEVYNQPIRKSKREDSIGFDKQGFGGMSCYEVLGLRSVQPSSRPPILEMTSEARGGLRWAANDCAASAASLRRARPERPLAASFFDRLELLRRVVLSEVAKASSNVEAMAAAGVAFDREMLLLAAEEIYSRDIARSKVLQKSPGNYDELAADLGTASQKFVEKPPKISPQFI